MYRVSIKILDDVPIDSLNDERETLYPVGRLYETDPDLHDRYSTAIYARLEEDDVLDSSDKLYMGLLQMYNSRHNGYALVKAIHATTRATINMTQAAQSDRGRDHGIYHTQSLRCQRRTIPIPQSATSRQSQSSTGQSHQGTTGQNPSRTV